MKIGINLLYLIPHKVGGTETYTKGLIQSLLKYDKKNKYYLFCNNENYDLFSKYKNAVCVRIPIRAEKRYIRLIVEQVVLPIYLYIYKIDLVHSLGYISPFIAPCKSIVNIYDLNWYFFPNDFSFLSKYAWSFFVRNSARFSDAVTTCSFKSRDSIRKILNINKRIVVIYPGLPEMEKPRGLNYLIKQSIKTPYIFSLSARYPHKNVIGLLKSFNIASKKIKNLNLVIAGLGGKSDPEVEKYISDNSLGSKIIILKWISDTLMSTLYKNAEAFVFTSKYEGFGLPLLECFKSSTPVISSTAYSLKEVLDNGGVGIDPDDHDKFADEIVKVLNNKKYQKQLSKISKDRGRDFSWKKAAITVMNLYQNIEK